MTSLRRRMIEDMQVRNLSPHTQTSYVQQVSLFARHFHQSPETLGPEEIRSYQVYLTNEKHLALCGRPWRCAPGVLRGSDRLPANAEAATRGHRDVRSPTAGGWYSDACRGLPGSAGGHVGSPSHRRRVVAV